MSVSNLQAKPLGKRQQRVALIVIATAQLMLVLDDTIANIALPSIQREFSVPSSLLPWIVNAYILAFGSLLLFGGRVGDLFGRRRVFKTGLVLFTGASLLGGLGPNVESLIAARGLQGIGAALAAPNALALIATTFPVGKARNSAMAVYGGMSALGITVGVLLGGVLTGMLSWRWVFFINIPIGLGVLAGTGNLIEGQRNTGRLGTFGAITGTVALVALTYGVTRSGEHAWTDPVTVAAFIIAIAMLLLFLFIQTRSKYPMLPLWLLAERNRAGSYATMLFTGAGLMGTFYLLTLFLQQVAQFSPARTGFAALPFSVGIILGAGISSKLVERLVPRLVAMPGLLLGAAGMYWLSTLTVDSPYVGHVMPAVLLTSFGLGMSAVTMTLTAVHGVAEEWAGVASAVVNMAQQIGAALGLALFTTVSVTAADGKLPQAAMLLQQGGDPFIVAKAGEALTYGHTTAFGAGAALLLLAAILAGTAVNTRQRQQAGGVAI
ncbi:MFS transporter [Herbaspirillum sp. GCM10030257]|uniref:MFS transporter n=1 Tax=Herbaspirillum sp. GCM10030257 TaxID=3273393 RepID=UPI00361F4AC2